MALARLPTYLEFGHMMGVITENPVRRDVRCRSGCTMSTRGRLLTRSVEHYRVVAIHGTSAPSHGWVTPEGLS